MMENQSHSRSSSRSQPTGRKFKDSCNSCASAKVKCSRDKPQCTRCEDRGLTCNYSLSQRSGRRPAASQGNSGTQQSTSQRASIHGTPSATDDDAITLNNNIIRKGKHIQREQTTKSTTQVSELPTLSDSPSFDPGDFGAVDVSAAISWESVTRMMIDTGVTSPVHHGDTLFGNYIPDLLHDPSNMWMSSLPPLDTSTSDFALESSSGSYVSETASLIDTEVAEPCVLAVKDPNTNKTCKTYSCCPMKAEDILNRLRTHTPKTNSAASSGAGTFQSEVQSFESIVEFNRECIEGIMQLLQCACSAKQQTLFVIAMIVDEVLNRYNRAALDCAQSFKNRVSGSQKETLKFGVYQIELSNATRMCTVVILGELHLVVRLLNRLSQRSVELNNKDTTMQDAAEHYSAFCPSMVPSVLPQFEAAMRTRLRLVKDNLTQLMKQN